MKQIILRWFVIIFDSKGFDKMLDLLDPGFGEKSRNIHIECFKQFKWNVCFLGEVSAWQFCFEIYWPLPCQEPSRARPEDPEIIHVIFEFATKFQWLLFSQDFILKSQNKIFLGCPEWLNWSYSLLGWLQCALRSLVTAMNIITSIPE